MPLFSLNFSYNECDATSSLSLCANQLDEENYGELIYNSYFAQNTAKSRYCLCDSSNSATTTSSKMIKTNYIPNPSPKTVCNAQGTLDIIDSCIIENAHLIVLKV